MPEAAGLQEAMYFFFLASFLPVFLLCIGIFFFFPDKKMPDFFIEVGRGRKHTEVCLTNTKQLRTRKKDTFADIIAQYACAVNMQSDKLGIFFIFGV
ncbi:MAG: hypothetical protein JWN14_556 [Chthonomonadales bacterium]|nr:hypothetical protein [Chthonomonadales bacterium]